MARDQAYRQAEQRIEKARQEGAIELDLSKMELTEIPEAITYLTQLQRLDLSRNQLTAVPEAIASLTQLQTLILSRNQLTAVPEAIASLTQLQTFILYDNKLTAVPEAIASLTQLQMLHLSHNKLTAVPEVIASLTQLQMLYLSHNKLTAVPEAIASLTQLQTLDLSHNKLTAVPEVIASLTQLQTLDLTNNQLTLLPEFLSQLTQMQELYLSRNRLTSLPESLVHLSQLQTLGLSDNQLTSLPELLLHLTQLRTLGFSNNSLESLPMWLGKLTQLYTLGLASNNLIELPESIGSLVELRHLYLGSEEINIGRWGFGFGESTNKLSVLPDSICQLTQLRTLDLKYNNIADLPVALAKLEHLETLELQNNPLNRDLAAAYEQGTEAVLEYLRAKAEEQITLNEAKLILIGEGKVGKSCLLGALRGDEWVDGRPTTHGIEIKPVIVTDPDSGTEITLNGWDFGGQSVYRPTHQLFFSSPAVYLVVWKPREGIQQNFVKEWITLIKHRAPDAKVLIVATHGGPKQRQPDIDKQEILDQFGKDTVLDFFHVDSKPQENTTDDTELARLKDTIARIAASLPEVGRSVPAKWQQVREILKTSNEAYLPYDQVIEICAEQGINKQQAELFLAISHRLGHLIHYDYDPTLRDIVILKPDWLAKAISFVLDDKMTRNRNGLVEFEHLSQLWSNPPFDGEEGYPKEQHPVFLRLMERFDLSYKVVLNPNETSNTSLIAQLVPDTRPETLPNWGEQPEPGDRQQVQICRIVDSQGQFAVAEGLFYQLIVRLHKYSLGRKNYENSIHWQRGLMLDNDYNGRALLEYVGTDVKITVRAAYPEFFLYELTKEVKWLVENFWKGLICNVMVSCVTNCGKNQPGTGLFDVQKLIESKRQGMPKFPCMISGCNKWLDIDELMRNAPTPPQTTVEEKLAEEFREVKRKLDDIKEGVQALDQNDKRILSQVDQQFATLMQMLTDEAKDGPRLFSFKPVDPKFFDKPKWISAKFQLTLWCEHARQPLPYLNPNDPQKGVYELDLPREWFTKAVPYLKLLTGTLSLVLPVATSATKFMLDDTAYKAIEEQLDLGQKTLESVAKSGDMVLNGQSKNDALLSEGEAILAQGAILRELHALLKEKDPGFGGLVRVQNKRREFLWVDPQFVNEY